MGTLDDRIGRRRLLLLDAAGLALAPAMLIVGYDRHLSADISNR